MINPIKPLTLFAALASVVACGGGGGGGGGQDTANTTPAKPVEAPTETPIERTADLVADRTFSFDVGQLITLSIDKGNAGKGALHIYSQAAHTFENGDVAAEPTSRVTTIYPAETDEVTLQVNNNWTKIYAQWVPMTSSEEEQTWTIDLNQTQNAYHLAF